MLTFLGYQSDGGVRSIGTDQYECTGVLGTLLRWKPEAIFRTIHFSLTVRSFSYIEAFHNPLIMVLNWVSYYNMTSLVHFEKDRKAKLESAYSFMLKYSIITVCNRVGKQQKVDNSHLDSFDYGWNWKTLFQITVINEFKRYLLTSEKDLPNS